MLYLSRRTAGNLTTQNNKQMVKRLCFAHYVMPRYVKLAFHHAKLSSLCGLIFLYKFNFSGSQVQQTLQKL